MPGPPPPPPPPPPMPGFGGGPPPPPPGGIPARPPLAAAKDRGALLGDISKGVKLKKATVVSDRSAPIIGKEVGGSSAGPPIGGAPPIPGIGRPSGLAPPVPSGNRRRSNSDHGRENNSGGGGDSGLGFGAPQLGGLLAGGMPKLKSRSGGIDTGAVRDSSHFSDPETSVSSKPQSSTISTPRPPVVSPKLPGGRPLATLNHQSSTPSFGGLKKPQPPKPLQRPASNAISRPGQPPLAHSSSATTPPRAPPQAPPQLPGLGGPKPNNPPPFGFRKPSGPAPPPPPPPSSSAPSAPPVPPPPPPSAPSLPVPRLPTTRLTPPPPPPPPATAPNGAPGFALRAARTALSGHSPAAPPPPPPPTSAPAPPVSSAPPPPPASRVSPQPSRMLDPSSYTLSGGGPNGRRSSTGRKGTFKIEDPRFRFQPNSELPTPRDMGGGQKLYRAGRGSSVPLDLSAFD